MDDPITRKIPNCYSHYRRLDAATREIRLIEARTEGDRIACFLFRTTLAKAPPYQALSYCWGSLHETVPINLELGENTTFDPAWSDEVSPRALSQPSAIIEDFQITTNLHAALRSFIASHSTRFLWADMLCINQGDIGERNDQVSFMREVYGSAASVRVWLGEIPGRHTLLEDSGFADLIIFFLFVPQQIGEQFTWTPFLGEFKKAMFQTPANCYIRRFTAQYPDSCIPFMEVGKKNNLWQWTTTLQDMIRHLVFWIHYPLLSVSNSVVQEYLKRVLLPSSSVWKLLGGVLLSLSNAPTATMRQEEGSPYLEFLDSTFDLVSAVTQSNWFRRIWVVQEVTNNIHVEASCGYRATVRSFPLFPFLKISRLWGQTLTENHFVHLHWREVPILKLNHPNYPSIWNFIGEWNPDTPQPFVRLFNSGSVDDYDGPRITLMKLMEFVGVLEASDLRDKVNAISSIQTDTPSMAPAFRPNYTDSIKKTYTRFMQWVVLAKRSLGMLMLVEPNTPHRLYLGLPSWVPDFSKIPSHVGRIRPKEFSACGKNDHPRIKLSSDYVLSAWGTEVAIVRATVSRERLNKASTKVFRDRDGSGFPILQALWTVSAINHELFVQQRRSPSKLEQETFLEFFCDTLKLFCFWGAENVREDLIRALQSAKAQGSLNDMPDHAMRNLWLAVERKELSSTDRNWGTALDLHTFEEGENTFFFTREGKLGICHESVQEGDRVVLLDGSDVPCIIRQTPDPENMSRSERVMQGPNYKFVGCCCLPGYMYGEIFNSPHFHDPLHEDPLDPDPLREELKSEGGCRGVYRGQWFNIE